jgi:DNA topoisomerase III
MDITTLYICEKPSQARDIARVLQCYEKKEGYFKNEHLGVTWCFGHLLETAAPEHYCKNIKPWRMEVLPIVPEKWEMQIKKEASKQFNIIKKLLKTMNLVVIATDADREGEVIAREILETCNYKDSIKRLWLSALDDASILKALDNMRNGESTEKLYHAGLGRQRADWLIGMNMTIASSVLFGKYGEGVLSVGRVQTPTLKLIVDRDHAIEHFISKEYFELFADFETEKKELFSAKWIPSEKYTDDENRILDKKHILDVIERIRGKNATVIKFDNKNKQQSAPLCLSLSQLQKLASSRFSFSAKETLEIAQSLYETHKATTYPRTDCGYLPESQFNECKIILPLLKNSLPHLNEIIDECDPNFRSSVWNDKKITAHHGIIPTTNNRVDVNKMSDHEKKLYDLICRYYVAQFLGQYEYAERTVLVDCCNELFKASNHTPLKSAWKRIIHDTAESDEDENKEKEPILPLMSVNDALSYQGEKCLAKNTKPPAKFTEGTLIEAMKSIGKYVTDDKYRKILKDTARMTKENS